MIDWSFILSAIGAIVLAVTLIILIIQTWIFDKQAKAALDASSAQSLAQMLETELKINEVFLRKPELRQYFYGGVHLEENSPVYADAESAAELFLDIMEHVLWQARFFPQLFAPEKSGEGYKDTWKNYFVYFKPSTTKISREETALVFTPGYRNNETSERKY